MWNDKSEINFFVPEIASFNLRGSTYCTTMFMGDSVDHISTRERKGELKWGDKSCKKVGEDESVVGSVGGVGKMLMTFGRRKLREKKGVPIQHR